MAVSYISALFHADDDNGTPLVGGLLYTYENWTTTPAVTYSDAGGATPNTNPIVLNSRGEAKVFIRNDIQYTFTLKTAGGTLVWDTDDVSAPLDLSALSGYAPLASPALTGTPTAPTPTAGDNTTKLATTAFIATAVAALAASVAPTACRLSITGGNLVLSRYNGNRLAINGTPQSIPGAGASLSPTGTTNSTLYYIYAYMSSGTMAIEFSATGYATDSATGLRIKNGDGTRALVGMARTSSGGAWEFCRSWYNDPGFVAKGVFTAERAAVNATTYTEVNSEIRTGWLNWLGETVCISVTGSVRIDAAFSTFQSAISIDGTTQDGMNRFESYAANADYPVGMTVNTNAAAEGYHYATIVGYGGPTFSGWFSGSASTGERTTLYVSINNR